MADRCPAPRQLPLIAVLLIATPGADAGPGNIEPDTAGLCRRIFDAIDEPAITFGLQGHDLRPSAYAALDRVINFARNCPAGTITIIGHSDSIGDESFNLVISRLRARSVADYLQKRGVPADRLRIEGRGSSQPIATNDTRSGRAKNRRIELRLTTPPGDR